MPLWVHKDEAKNKWCPNLGKDQMPQKCCADMCMAWRWVRTNIPDKDGNISISSKDTHGFCGLAGRPSYD